MCLINSSFGNSHRTSKDTMSCEIQSELQESHFLPDPTLAFLTPRTFFCLFFLSLRCFRLALPFSARPSYKGKRITTCYIRRPQHLSISTLHVSNARRRIHVLSINPIIMDSNRVYWKKTEMKMAHSVRIQTT